MSTSWIPVFCPKCGYTDGVDINEAERDLPCPKCGVLLQDVPNYPDDSDEEE